jgi:hypothetical protein
MKYEMLLPYGLLRRGTDGIESLPGDVPHSIGRVMHRDIVQEQGCHAAASQVRLEGPDGGLPP